MRIDLGQRRRSMTTYPRITFLDCWAALGLGRLWHVGFWTGAIGRHRAAALGEGGRQAGGRGEVMYRTLLATAMLLSGTGPAPQSADCLAACLLTQGESYWESQTSVRWPTPDNRVTQRFFPDSTGWTTRLDMPGYGREAFAWRTVLPDSLVVVTESGARRARRATCTSGVLTFHFGQYRYRWYRMGAER